MSSIATAAWVSRQQAATRPTAARHGDRWLPSEIDTLELLLTSHSTTEVARLLGRSYAAVSAMANLLRNDKPQPKLGTVCPSCFTTRSLTGHCDNCEA
jgi:hypothetical protein